MDTTNQFDKACRYLLKLDSQWMLAWLLGIPRSEIGFIRWMDTRRLSFPGQPDRTCDTVAHIQRLDDNHRSWALVVEFNIEADALMFGRLLNYRGSLWIEEKPTQERGDRFALGALVINLTGVGTTSRLYSWPSAGVESALTVRECNFSTLQATKVLEDIATGVAPLSALPWIPLMQGGNELDIIEKWKELAATEPVSLRRADYGALAMVFASHAKQHHVWKSALKEWNMFESEVVNEWQDMARRQQAANSVLMILQDKFGKLPADLPNHLQAIDDLSVLDQLLLKASHSGNLDEFQKQIPNGKLPKP